jgi:hypothetical protein
LLARTGADVEYLTPGFSPVSVRLIDTQDAPFIMKRLHDAGVRISPTTYITSIEEGRLRVYNVHSLEERVIDNVAAVVLSTGRLPLNDLEHELEGKVGQFFVIGDALAPRFLSNASYEGQKFARLIGEPSAGRSIVDVYFAPDDPDTMPFPADVAR